MNRRRITVAGLVLLLAAIAAQPSRTVFDVDIDLASEAPSREIARAEAAVRVGGATLLLTWTQAALR